MIVRDVFAGPDTPRALAPGGVFVANVGDRPGLANARAQLAGLAEVFAHTAAAAPTGILGGREYGNVVLAASDAPLAFSGEVPWKPGADLSGATPALRD